MTEQFSQERMTALLQERLGDATGGLADQGQPAVVHSRHAGPEEFAALFTTPLGQKVLTQLVGMTVLQPTWDADRKPEHGHFREGQNSLVQFIIDQINAPNTEPGVP